MPSGRRPSSARQSVPAKPEDPGLGALIDHGQASGAHGNRADTGQPQVGVRPAGRKVPQRIELKDDLLIEQTAVGLRLFLQPLVQIGRHIASGEAGYKLCSEDAMTAF